MLKLKKDSLEWALNLALNSSDTDIFPLTFEFRAIQYDSSLLEKLSDENVLEWQTRSFRRCLTPKHKYGFRISTQLDPLDFLLYTALVYEIGLDLESRRVSADEGIVHSYRFSPNNDSQIYNPNFSYKSFTERTIEITQNEQYSHVVIADIADFFPRIYTHRVENALRQATKRTNHALAIKHLIGQWNENFSYGIPVGPTASRLIAEVTLDDVDRALLSERATFIRYSDDFRIFCRSQREAHERLAFLANVLFENHGLTLQQSKTRILHTDKFTERYLLAEDLHEFVELSNKFLKIISDLGLSTSYEPINWNDLTPKQQSEIQSLNLVDILQKEARSEEIDIGLCKFILRRLAQLQNAEAVSIVVNQVDNLYPVFPDIVNYINSLISIDFQEKVRIGRSMLELLSSSVVSHLEFHQMWLLTLFSNSQEFNHETEFVKLYNTYTDRLSRRELILALGRSHQDYWFRSQKRKVFEFEPWQRRAILLAGSCLPADERKHWYLSLEPRLDPLELSVIKFARSHPI